MVFILRSFAVILLLLCCTLHELHATVHYVAPDGSDSASGESASPYRTFRHAVSQLDSGDELVVREGVYFDRDVTISTGGVTIRGESASTPPTVDGQYTESLQWEVFDAARHVYRTTTTLFSSGNQVYGYFEDPATNSWHKLVPYEDFSYMQTDEQLLVPNDRYYVGHGLHFNSADNKVYVRLQRTELQVEVHGDDPGNLDARLINIIVFDAETLLKIEAPNVRLENLRLVHGGYGLDVKSGAHFLTLDNVELRAGRYGLTVRTGVHDLTLHNILVRDFTPRWVAWDDVKEGLRAAHLFQGALLTTDDDVSNVELAHSYVSDIFDVFDGGIMTNVTVAHNTFEGIRDDITQIDTGSYDMNFHHNLLIGIFSGFSYNGGAASPAGSVGAHVHHNIFDHRLLSLYSRYTKASGGTECNDKAARSQYAGQSCQVPSGSYGTHGTFASQAYWSYYNTHVIDWGICNCGVGWNRQWSDDVLAYHLNNLVIAVRDMYYVSRGGDIDKHVFDGNVYVRPSDATIDLFGNYIDTSGSEVNFATLDDFRASSFFTATKSNYAPGWENSGIETNTVPIDTDCLQIGFDECTTVTDDYRPLPTSVVASGAVPLMSGAKTSYHAYRGAVDPSGNECIGKCNGGVPPATTPVPATTTVAASTTSVMPNMTSAAPSSSSTASTTAPQTIASASTTSSVSVTSTVGESPSTSAAATAPPSTTQSSTAASSGTLVPTLTPSTSTSQILATTGALTPSVTATEAEAMPSTTGVAGTSASVSSAAGAPSTSQAAQTQTTSQSDDVTVSDAIDTERGLLEDPLVLGIGFALIGVVCILCLALLITCALLRRRRHGHIRRRSSAAMATLPTWGTMAHTRGTHSRGRSNRSSVTFAARANRRSGSGMYADLPTRRVSGAYTELPVLRRP